MPISSASQQAIRRLNRVASHLKMTFACRDTAVDLMQLALVCHEHCLFLGTPGTAKSELVTRFARAVQARPFHYLLTRFTEPAELFGPVDLKEFTDRQRYHVRTDGMLPTAEVAFLDEVFQASSAILNTLLTLIHERRFHNGAEIDEVPLIALFGASNHLPDDPTLHAFSDRFVLRLEIEPVPDESLDDLLTRGWEIETSSDTPAGLELVSTAQIEQLNDELGAIALGDVYTRYQELIRSLRAEGVALSDRRLVKGLKLIRAAALLAGRDQATPADLWPLNHIWNNPNDRAVLHELVQPLVDEAGGPALASHRPLLDLREEFLLLESRAEQLRGDGACTAHLGALGQIRRELINHYPQERELLGRLEAVVQQVLERMRAE